MEICTKRYKRKVIKLKYKRLDNNRIKFTCTVKKLNNCMARVLLARYQLSLYLHISSPCVCPFVSSSVTVCPFIHLLLYALTSPLFAYSLIHSFIHSVTHLNGHAQAFPWLPTEMF